MNKTIAWLAGAAVFVAGLGMGYAAGKQPTPDMYHGKGKQDAAQALADVALVQAGADGSWERIAVGRAYYLGGMRAKGQAIFDALLKGKHEDSDLFRIARVYREAGEWNKARPLFEDYLTRNSDDEKDLTEIGAYYLMNGDRKRAEQLFDKAIDINADEVWVSIGMAGAYLGVVPQ
jgi:tetratricopeptide (TPR) repeat protein